ncbi:hypothetical protein SO802_016771 [Lithocarpus litseifolius]|uniref:Cation efflux protein transmembrane domain-containing protein n=1 Tax=Lithocarpus litseifolius TaxID=425828 RepID=A0AAW2D0U9_9ROSI
MGGRWPRSPVEVSGDRGRLKTSKSSSESKTSTFSSSSLIVGWDGIAFSSIAHWDGNAIFGPEDNVAEYYQQQAEMLEGFNEMDELTERGSLPRMSKEVRDKLARSETLAIRISNIANMFLFAAKVYASVRTGSLAMIASTLDSLLDLLSGFILWFTAFSRKTPNPYQYPIEKRRMQPLVGENRHLPLIFKLCSKCSCFETI